MHMKLAAHIAAATIAALSIISCGAPKEPADPLESALISAIAQKVGDGAKVTITEYARMDSTTFGEELATRRKSFEVKQAQEEKYVEKYRAERMEANARKHSAALAKTKDILAGFDVLEASMAARKDEIAYYQIAFSGKAVLDGVTTPLDGYYAVITPTGEVKAIQGAQKGLTKAMGHVIPGYTELIKGEETEE